MSAVRLSLVMPYFRRIGDFKRVFPMNRPHFARADLEIVLVIDDPFDAQETLEYVRAQHDVRFRVLLNEKPHAWRNPAPALNVGIRHARGEFVLVMSPESACVDDVPARLLRRLDAAPDCAVIGQVAFATYDGLAADGSLAACFDRSRATHDTPWYYGSFCAARRLLFEVHGYDEAVEGWGGDDDNLRHRLVRHGVILQFDDDVRIVHLADKPRVRMGNPEQRSTPRPMEEKMRIFCPPGAIANPDGWGLDFDHVVHDWEATARSR